MKTVLAVLVALAAFLAVSYAVIDGGAQGVNADLRNVDYYAYPQYQYGYGVNDDLTGDGKKHVETRDGGVVRGEYRINEPDGTVRIVTYTADAENGYRATVRREGVPNQQPIPTPPSVPVAPAPIRRY